MANLNRVHVWRRRFKRVFLITAPLFVFVFAIGLALFDVPKSSTPGVIADLATPWVLLLSFVAAVASLIGWITSIVIIVRKELREPDAARRELALAKSRAEAVAAAKKERRTLKGSAQWRRMQTVFMWAFLASIIILVGDYVVYAWWPATVRIDPTPSAGLGEGDNSLVKQALQYLALVASFTSLIGWGLTTYISVRKERRESIQARLDSEKKELEIAKLRSDLAALQSKKNTEPRRVRRP